MEGDTERRELTKKSGEEGHMGRVGEAGGTGGVTHRSEVVALEMDKRVGGERYVGTSASKEEESKSKAPDFSNGGPFFRRESCQRMA